MGSNTTNSRDPLHGVSLEKIVTQLVEHYGFKNLAQKIPINCFITNPSVKSSLTFLRKTPWAKSKVEDLYIFYTTEQLKLGKK